MLKPSADRAARAAQAASAAGWLQSAVFALDRRIRRRIGVNEYTLHPQCLFRLQVVRLDDPLVLAGGTSVAGGAVSPVLHLWNEQMPVI
jgi:hypothetical protein